MIAHVPIIHDGGRILCRLKPNDRQDVHLNWFEVSLLCPRDVAGPTKLSDSFRERNSCVYSK